MFFWFQAAEEDGSFSKQRCHWLGNECEMAAVNSKSRTSLRMHNYIREKGRELVMSASVPSSPKLSNIPKSLQRSSSANALDNDEQSKSFSLFMNQGTSSENLKVDIPFEAHSFEDKGVLNSEYPIPTSPSRRKSAPPQPNFSIDEMEKTESSDESVPQSNHKEPNGEPKPLKEEVQVQAQVVSKAPQTPSKPKRTPSSSDVKLVVPPSPSRVQAPIELLDADNINSKKSRHFYFQAQLHFLSCLTSISAQLKKYTFRTKAEYNILISI